MNYSSEEFRTIEILISASIRIGSISKESGRKMIEKLKEEFIQKEIKKAKATVTIHEASEILGVSRMTVHRYIKQGLLPKIKISAKTVRIPFDAVNNLLTVEV